MKNFVPFMEEGLSVQQQDDKIREIFHLLSDAIKTRNPFITLPAEEWTYVMLPGRLDKAMQQQISVWARSLTWDGKTVAAIIVKPRSDCFPIIREVLSLENDFVYFLAFAIAETDDGQLLSWITHAMDEDGPQDGLPEHALLALDGGMLLQE